MSALHLQGIYPPVPTFFTPDEELDLATLEDHLRWLAESDIAGYVVLGSNGEAPHLTSEEREQVIRTARQVIDQLDHPKEKARFRLQLLAGCGEQSTRATIAGCERAARAGADAVLVLPPFYFRGRMTGAALLAHYRAVANYSPLPVVIYNMPANTAGLDMEASLICRLAEEHPNIIGLKDSAGNIAKLAQIVGQLDASRPDFAVLAGSAGFLLPALAVGARGGVPALANVLPQQVCRVQTLFASGCLEEARRLQARLVALNTLLTTTYSVAGLKAALQLLRGYGGPPRSPVLPLDGQELAQLRAALAPFVSEGLSND
ncbi:dihydrodipicolinate synthase family protein [Thermogemmatispora aurantia]|uniref:Dihydrodipicolinate synthase family protein n=1 Tax=Thermogemmatispora aurantia TaxID=2045279 RepID=A0A5J4JZ88_9CHLR|nr:dihydrodipicolinate synthase family protein [Thermogemmatispora aurantia]GER82364.1 dihydrodipicolinate synthase family protein [Thermogemmatispora aurantia]